MKAVDVATLAALTVLYRPDELPAHLRRAVDNGLSLDEISALSRMWRSMAGFRQRFRRR